MGISQDYAQHSPRYSGGVFKYEALLEKSQVVVPKETKSILTFTSLKTQL